MSKSQEATVDKDQVDDENLEDAPNDMIVNRVGSLSDSFEADRSQATNNATSSGNSFHQTLPRFPVAETNNKNCWSEPSIEIFRVRGSNYLNDRKKIPSGPYLLRARGCDLFLTENPPRSIGKNSAVLGGALRTVPTFLINFRFPWGLLIFYFEIPKRYRPYLQHSEMVSMEDLSPAERTMARFFMADEKEKNSRLKLIPYIAEGPWIARNMVTGKPAIIGNKLPVKYTFQPASDDLAECLEAELDIGGSSNTAKRIVSVCRRYMNALTLDIGFVVQGNTVEELPEQMLGSVRVHSLDPQNAPTLE